ncbi:flagellar basal body rod protein FlgB [Listeria seeligeri]|uniref:Flagellar basal body rod protein FlgB n=2 Tax=Listeria seeligeri TaxID=1640 RepID=A0ABR5E4Y1_LISSE|nr:flagellar basal body rod protein FlgB [Listeria seeligeri]EFS00957.1 flagellar basal-body rod protein FlgB [Listeria seeligeri FSL N1-067]KKD44769.1 flagellar basal body rod protein FlgB [Listeria seeligeri]MBF2373485.1 flagellar basal body rod protein FlgB [Listeria seeligeri]MBF2416419.1 flagellar basal body rod protein FlgB [Listeria seeligeri]MBF2449338.1 flagellar basal body rod protein FlgB [Listeria seeligeri]
MENYTTHIGNYLNYLQTANQVVSNNIANANTSNFKASETSFEESLGSSLRPSGQNNETTTGSLTKTNSKHLTGTEIDQTNAKVTNKGGSINEDGNNVNVTSEMISLTKNNQMYALAISALNYNSSINTAARGK